MGYSLHDILFGLLSSHCSNNLCNLFRCRHAALHSGIRIILVSSLYWWGGVQGGATMSL